LSIRLTDSDGLTRPAGTILCPRWSSYLWWTGWVPDGSSVLASVEERPETILVLRTSGHVVRELRGHNAGINAAVCSPDGMRVATGAWDGTLRLWSREAHCLHRVRLVPGGSVESVGWSPGGKLLAAACSDGRLILLDGSDARVLREWTLSGKLFSLSWHPGGDIVSVSGTHGWSHVPLRGAPTARADQGTGVEISWSPEGHAAAVTTEDGDVWIDGFEKALHRLVHLGAAGRGIAWHPAGRLAVGDAAGGVRVVTAAGNTLGSCRLSGEVVAVRWCPDGSGGLLAATRGAEAVLLAGTSSGLEAGPSDGTLPRRAPNDHSKEADK